MPRFAWLSALMERIWSRLHRITRPRSGIQRQGRRWFLSQVIRISLAALFLTPQERAYLPPATIVQPGYGTQPRVNHYSFWQTIRNGSSAQHIVPTGSGSLPLVEMKRISGMHTQGKDCLHWQDTKI